jgi:pimeloyl-ACP methyl ester carboxylesterase
VTLLVGAASTHLDAPGGRTTAAYMAELASRLPRGRMVLVQGAGHFHPQERPATVAEEVNAAALVVAKENVKDQQSRL